MDSTFPETTERMMPNFMVDLRSVDEAQESIDDNFGFTLFEAVRSEDMPNE